MHEALKAADASCDGVARVIDCYSIKPIDGATLRRRCAETGQLVVVEDHWPEGGLGEAVLAALAEHGRARATSRTSPSATCRTPGSRTSCSPRSGSTRRRSWGPRGH